MLRIALPCLALALAFACQAQPPGGAEVQLGSGPGQPGAAATVATVSKVRGRAGVVAEGLPAGAFLGEGASLEAGQRVTLPRGTRAELVLANGARLRLDEDSVVVLPSRGEAQAGVPPTLTVERGRVVVLAEAEQSVEVLAADDRLVIERGEVELQHLDETRRFGVIAGRAVLHTGGRELPLGPGASITTPASPSARPEAPPDPSLVASALTPITSLAPLHESAWTAAFDETKRIAADLPEGVGSLVARRAGSQVERQSLRLTEQRVHVTIAGRIARTEIEQAFYNDSSQTLEGIYQFPLPSDASISDLQLLIGDTWMRGEMLEKTRARQIFRQIVDATVPRDPALLQWEQGSVFSLNIFPIPGKGERRIKIAYTQVLPDVGDTLRYRYPMGGSGATATEIGDFAFEVTVDDAGLGAGGRELLAQISTPMAELARDTTPAGDLRLSLRERDYQPTHELGVDIPLVAEHDREHGPRVLAASHRDRDGQGYFMLTLRPELDALGRASVSEQGPRRPVHYAFVLDRSHSTTPELWTAAEGLTKALLSALEPDDRFTILACDSACDRLDGGLRDPRGPAALAEVDRFLNSQVLAGASDLGAMLVDAAESLGARPFAPTSAADLERQAERVVVYLGDGSPTSGLLTPDELGQLVQDQLGATRIQAVALGSRSDLLTLDHLVRQSGGDLLQADARDNLDAIARELRLRAAVPVVRELALELPPGLTAVYPQAIPALRPGDSLTVVGKLADPSRPVLGDVRLRGRTELGEIDERFAVELDAFASGDATGVHAHLPRTWAQAEITHLTQTLGADARERIIALSRDYNVLSRYTALLVLENDRMYREFNVARKADDKDGWTGKTSSEPSKDAKPTEELEAKNDADAPLAPASTPAAEPSPDPEVWDDRAEREDSFAGFDDEDAKFAETETDELAGGDIGTSGRGDSGSGWGGGGTAGPTPSPSPSQPSGANERATSKKKIADSSWEEQAFPGKPTEDSWDGYAYQKRRPQPRFRIDRATGPSASERERVAELKVRRDANPSDRNAHRDLVRTAVRVGHPDAVDFTAAWATADPDHAPALLAHADQLAAAGDPLALRAYASAVEVEPFSATLHQRMAKALATAGDFARSCSHRRALVSLDPADGDAARELVECLLIAGREGEARAALTRSLTRVGSTAGRRALAEAEALFARGVVPAMIPAKAFVHSYAELRAELRWTAGENLDIALVDGRGRRLSVLRPQGVLVREDQDGVERSEILTLRKLSGAVHVEVTRPSTGAPAQGPIAATLTVITPEGRERFSLRLDVGSQRVAVVRKL